MDFFLEIFFSIEYFLGIFLLLAGLIIGLGAVTVIDLHGFLARKSTYWTVATTRTHKVTKPLIWVGIIMYTLGTLILGRNSFHMGIVQIQLLIIGVLVVNGLFLSFNISPFLLAREKNGTDAELLPKKIQRKIVLSFLVSFIGWWSLVGFMVYAMR